MLLLIEMKHAKICERIQERYTTGYDRKSNKILIIYNVQNLENKNTQKKLSKFS